MGWSMVKTSGILTQFKVNQRMKPAQASHSNRFILVTTSKFINVFSVDVARDQGSSTSLKHVLSISCYDVVSAAQMVCSVGGSNEKEAAEQKIRIVVVTRGGDLLTVSHPALDAKPRKRKGDLEDDERTDENPILIKLKVEDKLHSFEGIIIGMKALSCGQGYSCFVVERKCDGAVKINLFQGGIGGEAEGGEAEGGNKKPFRVTTMNPVPVISNADYAAIEVVIPNSANLKSCLSSVVCPTCMKRVPTSIFDILVEILQKRCQSETTLPSPPVLLILAFGSGLTLISRFNPSSGQISDWNLLVDFLHSIIHFDILLGDESFCDTKSDVSNAYFLGVSKSGSATKLALNGKNDLVETFKSDLVLPDSPNIALLSGQELLFSSGSFFYAFNLNARDSADSAHTIASSRLFSHSNILSFSLIRDPDLSRVPDLLFFIDDRGDFYYRRLAARGSLSSDAEKHDFQQMSNFITKAAELTRRKQRSLDESKALNEALKNLVICGHLRKAGGRGVALAVVNCEGEKKNNVSSSSNEILRVSIGFERREDGATVQVDLALTLCNNMVDFAFDDGWSWNLVLRDRGSTGKKYVSTQRSLSLKGLGPGEFQRAYVPLQDLGLRLSNALQSDFVVEIVVTFAFSDFIKSRQNPFLSLHFHDSLDSDVTFVFPVWEGTIDFLDAMSPRWTDDSSSSSSSSSSSFALSKPRSLSIRDSESSGVNDDLIAEHLIDDIAQSRPEMLVFEELLLSHSFEPTSGKKKPSRFRSRLDLKSETVHNLGLSTSCGEEERCRVLSELLNVKSPVPLERNSNERCLALSDPFSSQRCSVFLRSCAEAVSPSGLFIELVSISAQLIFVLRELISRRLAKKMDNVEGADAKSSLDHDRDLIKSRMKDLDEVQKKLRQAESCSSNDIQRILLEATLLLMEVNLPI